MLIPEEKRKQQELETAPRSPGTPTISDVSSISPSTRDDTEGGDLPPAYAPPNNDITVHRSETSEPPPISKPSTPIAGPSSPPPLTAESTFAGVKPSNLLFVQKDNSSIKGTFVIDPSLRVPEAALSPLPEGEKRHNALLLSKNGGVHADIHLAFPPSKGIPEKGARTSLFAKSHNGSVTLKARRDPADPTPLFLHATSENGSADIYLPRDFEGPITLSTKHGSIKRSTAVLDHSTLFFESGGIQRGFVGDHTAWGADAENWRGDEALLESKNGTVRVWFVDEGDYSASASSGKSFFSKLFRS